MPAEHTTQASVLVSPSLGLNVPAGHAVLEVGVPQKNPSEHGMPFKVVPSGQYVPGIVHGSIVSGDAQYDPFGQGDSMLLPVGQ